MPQAIETLLDDPNELKAMLIAERARNERLLQIIKEMATSWRGGGAPRALVSSHAGASSSSPSNDGRTEDSIARQNRS